MCVLKYLSWMMDAADGVCWWIIFLLFLSLLYCKDYACLVSARIERIERISRIIRISSNPVQSHTNTSTSLHTVSGIFRTVEGTRTSTGGGGYNVLLYSNKDDEAVAISGIFYFLGLQYRSRYVLDHLQY